MQCHLETTSFSLPNTVQRFDRGTFSYKPGEPLANYTLHFDHATGHQEKFEIVNSVYRLRQSACFLKSAEGKLLCTTCHNPHRALRGDEAARAYAAVCRNCHSSSHAPSPDCTGCHMPKRRTEDVVHAVMTDHKIQRRAPANPLAMRAERHGPDAAYQGEVKLYYPPNLPPSPDRDLYIATAQVVQKSNLAKGIEQLETAIRNHNPPGPEFHYDLAQAYLAAGDSAKALLLYKQAITKRAEFFPAWRGMGALLVRNGDIPRGIEALERARTLFPRDAPTREELARAYQRQSRLEAAIQEAREAIRLDSLFPEAHNALGGMLFEKGDRTTAEYHFREAIRLRPDYAEAHNNLANLLSAASDLNQADYHFDIAIRLAPTQAVTRFNYGISLAVRRRFDEAQRQFELAVTYAPTMAEAHESLGNLVARRGDWRTAIRHYEAALKARPGFDRAILGLGTAYGGLGDLATARKLLQQAATSSQPAVRIEAQELLQRMP
jgi:FimV-like protein